MKCLVAFAFMACDFSTGIIKAFKRKEFTSSVMREGLFNKSAMIFLIFIAMGLDYAQKIIDLGFSVPLGTSCCTYIIFMETLSTIENIGGINNKLIPKNIEDMFLKLNENEILGDLLESEGTNENNK